jgi:hypothetical protein
MRGGPNVERPDVERPDVERPDVERPDVDRLVSREVNRLLSCY